MVDYTNDPIIERLKFLRDHTYGQFPQNWPYPSEIQKVCADAIVALEAKAAKKT